MVNTPLYLDPAQWKQALLRSPTGNAIVLRPVAMLSFVLPMWAGYTAPFAHHLVNLAFHAGNVFLVTLLAWRTFSGNFSHARNAAAAVCACGLAYGLYPGLTESVLWISCRYDLMMTSFLFAALLIDRSRRTADWKLASGVGTLFLAALLCKESAVGFIFALPIAHLALDRTRSESSCLSVICKSAWSAHYRTYVVLILVLGIWLLFRLIVIDKAFGLSQVIRRFSDIGSVREHALVVLASYSQLISDAVWPFGELTPSRSLPVPVDQLSLLTTAAVAAPVVIAAFVGVFRTTTWRVPALLFFAFLAALLPVSNILPIPAFSDSVWAATRYLTFPVVFVCFALFALLMTLTSTWLVRYPKLPWIIAGGWIIASTGVVREAIPLWKDEGIFYRWAITRAAPRSLPSLLLNLGSYYVRTGVLPEARKTFALAIELKPRRNLASLLWYSLSNTDLRLGHYEQAILGFQNALAIDPDNVFGRIGIAQAERARGQPARAAAILEEGLRRSAASGQAHHNEDAVRLQLGLAYSDLGRIDEADVQLGLARALTQTADIRAEAEKTLEKLRSERK